MDMWIRLSLILPAVGLLLFAMVTRSSVHNNEDLQHTPHRFYWWSSLRLDTDPLNQHPKPPDRCKYDPEHCANWDLSSRHITPAWPDRVLVLSAFPAFLAGFAVAYGLGQRGTDEVLTFMVAMPMLLFTWYYVLGAFLDHWLRRLRRNKNVQLKLTS